MVTHEAIYAKNPNFVFRKIAGEFLLIPIRKKLNQVNSLYVLNEMGAEVWQRFDGRRSLETVLGELLVEFEVARDQLEKDTSTLVQDLLSIEAILPAVVSPQSSHS